MKKLLIIICVVLVRLTGAFIHLIFGQFPDAWSVLTRGECASEAWSAPIKRKKRRERVALTSDEVCEGMTTDAL